MRARPRAIELGPGSRAPDLQHLARLLRASARRSPIVATVSVVAALLTPIAHAAILKLDFSAVVRTVGGSIDATNDPAQFGIGEGSLISGSFVLDTDATDVTPPPDEGYYIDALQTGAVSSGSLDLLLDQSLFYRNVGAINGDSDRIDIIADMDATNGFAGGVSAILTFSESSGAALDSADFPTNYDLAQFDPFTLDVPFTQNTGVFLFIAGLDGSAIVSAEYLEVTVTPVPLPPALLLMTGAVAAVWRVGRRR